MNVNIPAIMGLDAAFKKWAAMKYDLNAIDTDNNMPIYAIAPEQWEDGDLDTLIAWDQWKSRSIKSQEQLREWIRIAVARGVNLDSLKLAFPTETEEEKTDGEKIGSLVFKGLVATAGVFGLRWLLGTPKMPEVHTVDMDIEKLKRAVVLDDDNL